MANYEELNKEMLTKMKELEAAVDRKDHAAVERLDGELKTVLDNMRAAVRSYVSANRLGTSH